MKIYEKPMVMVEKINVEDVITTSGEEMLLNPNAAAAAQLENAAGTTGAIVFDW